MVSLQNQIILLIFLLALSAFFSGSETAIVSMTRLKLVHLVRKKRKGAAVLQKLREDIHKTLTTILIGNNLVNVGASVLAASIAFQIFKSHAVSLATGIMTLLLLVFGEITPKTLATTYKDTISLMVARPIWFLTYLFWPLVWVFDIFTSWLTKNAPKASLITEDELKTMIKVGEETGEIESGEAQLLEKVFRFDDVNVSEIMTPRTDMVMIRSDAKLKDLAKLVSRYPYSRIPVFEKNKDNIIGIAFTRKLINEKDLNKSIKRVVDRVHFVPETQKIDTLLKKLQKIKQHMAIVVDEHGGVSGLVTLEDVLEEIVGDILDEKDKSMPEIRKIGKNQYFVQAKADIQDVNRKIKSRFREEEDFETLGGFILNKLERIPKEGDELEVDGFKISVKKLEGHRIKEVKIERN